MNPGTEEITSIGHRPRAVGKRVRAVMSLPSARRRLTDRADTRWQQTAHSFRHRTPVDWHDVV